MYIFKKEGVTYIYLVQIVLFVLPAVAFLLGGLGYFIFKNLYIGPLFVLITASISVYTVFNSSFWIWVVIYIWHHFWQDYLLNYSFQEERYQILKYIFNNLGAYLQQGKVCPKVYELSSYS